MFEENIKIPKDRIAVLIGEKGSVRRRLEKLTNTKIKVDSKEGIVDITADDSIDLFEAKPLIMAIARGFNPKLAEQLKNEKNCLEIINIEVFSGKSKKKFIRIKSRCIGKEGKAKDMLEKLTETDICIYGKTVAIIGEIEHVVIAKRAIESLLNGSKHGGVYAQIQKRKDELEKISDQ